MLSLFLNVAFSFNVIIDPGHGGTDTGASYFGYHESNITLEVAKKLQAKLNSNKDILSTMTREKNTGVDLSKRVSKAHQKKADLFVSIHTNSSSNPRIRGVEVYFENQLSPDQESLLLAYRENQFELRPSREAGRPSQFRQHYSADLATILDDIAKTSYHKEAHIFSKKIISEWKQKEPKKRFSIRQAPFFVVSSANMPSVLVEIGYLSNKAEARRLANSDYQEDIAEILYRSIVTYKENLNKRSKL